MNPLSDEINDYICTQKAHITSLEKNNKHKFWTENKCHSLRKKVFHQMTTKYMQTLIKR